MTDLEIEVKGECLTLMSEKAVYWPRVSTLFVADAHWGKAAAFRALALPIPESGEDDLTRLNQALARSGAARLVLLGDLLHAKASRAPSILDSFTAWRAQHPELEIVLVRGNHDERAGDPPGDWRVRCVDAPYLEAPFVWQHEPAPSKSGYVLAGHIHPGAVLIGAGRQSLKLPCFWFGTKVGVLPAFGSFTGTAAITPRQGDKVFVIADDQVLAV